MRSILYALPLLALAAPATAQTGYRALGTEPFWSLNIDARTMRLEEPGKRPVTVAKPRVRTTFNGQRYLARGMTVDVTRTRCSDGMSDRTYRDTVTVQVGRRTLKGCGGGTIAQSRLADTSWTVWQLNGRPVRAAQPLTVNFTADRMQGKFCNSFNGPYQLTGDRLRVDDIASTRMACRGAAMTTETTVFGMLRGPVTAKFTRWGTLTLTGGRNSVTLRPVRR